MFENTLIKTKSIYYILQRMLNIANLSKSKSIVANMTNTIKTLQDEVSSLKDEISILRDQMAIFITERHETNDKLSNHRTMIKSIINELMNERPMFTVDRFNEFYSQVQDKKLLDNLIKKTVELLIPYADNLNDIIFIKSRFASVLWQIYSHLSSILGNGYLSYNSGYGNMYINKTIGEKFKLEITYCRDNTRSAIGNEYQHMSDKCCHYPMATIAYEILVELETLYRNGKLDNGN